MLRGGGRGLAGNVGGGSGNGDTGQADDLPGDGIVGAADSHRGQTAGGTSGDDFPGGQHDGQRAGPEFFCQIIGLLGDMVTEQLDLLGTGNVQNQRIVLGAALGFEDLCHSIFVQTVGTQAVDGFRGDSNQLAVHDQVSRGGRGNGIGCG